MAKCEARVNLLPSDALKSKRLGISISDSPDLERLGLFKDHFLMALGELVRTVINAGGTLYYGGHLHPEGLTRFIIDELHRYGRRDRPLKVCLAWNVHRAMSSEQIGEQKEFLGLLGEICFLSPDGQRLACPVDEPVQSSFSAEEQASSLSGLRAFMADNTDARIVMGGKRAGFQGGMPGIFEEVLYSLKRRQPLYLAGGFGGATFDVIQAIRPNYAEWLPPIGTQAPPDDRVIEGLQLISKIVSDVGWDGYDNGLNVQENMLLAASYRPSEIAALVGRGMGRLLIGEQNSPACS